MWTPDPRITKAEKSARPIASAKLIFDSHRFPIETEKDMPKLAANLTMMFNELDFLDRFGAAAKAGFRGVEYLFPYDYDVHVPKQRLADHGLAQVLHNLPDIEVERGGAAAARRWCWSWSKGRRWRTASSTHRFRSTKRSRLSRILGGDARAG